MGGLDSAAAASLVADAYMAAPADVAVAPATSAAAAVGPVSCMDLFCMNFYGFVWNSMDLYGLDLCELVWTWLVLVVVVERNKSLFVSVYQMPAMLILIHEMLIVIYMKCLGYHIRNQQNKKLNLGPLPCAFTMAHGRVQKSQHTAKFKSLPCATSAGHTANSPHVIFPEFFFFCLLITYMVPQAFHIYHNDYFMYPNEHHRHLIHIYQ